MKFKSLVLSLLFNYSYGLYLITGKDYMGLMEKKYLNDLSLFKMLTCILSEVIMVTTFYRGYRQTDAGVSKLYFTVVFLIKRFSGTNFL